MKSPALRTVLAPLKDMQEAAFKRFEKLQKEYCLNKSEFKKLLRHWEKDSENNLRPQEPTPPILERLLIEDATIEAILMILDKENNGLLSVQDELASLFAGFNQYKSSKGADEATWLKLSSGDTIFLDRKTSNPPSIFIKSSAVSLTGGIQPEILKKISNSTCKKMDLLQGY